jgi:hypothetical protein
MSRRLISRNHLFITRLCRLAPLLILAGCNARDHELADVHGRITRGGQPVQNLSVTFQPIAKNAESPNPGPASYGITDADGRYGLKTITDDSTGAVVGSHRVVIQVIKKPSASDAADRIIDTTIPANYRDGSITLEVPAAGLSSADFELSPP